MLALFCGVDAHRWASGGHAGVEAGGAERHARLHVPAQKEPIHLNGRFRAVASSDPVGAFPPKGGTCWSPLPFARMAIRARAIRVRAAGLLSCLACWPSRATCSKGTEWVPSTFFFIFYFFLRFALVGRDWPFGRHDAGREAC